MNSNVAPRFTLDEQLEDFWQHIIKTLTMAADIAEAGAVLTVHRPSWIGAEADPVELLRNGVVRKIDAILARAKVI